jgi:hypothetical protein
MNIPSSRENGGVKIDNRTIYISVAALVLPIIGTLFALWGQIAVMQRDLHELKEQWQAQAVDRRDYRANTDVRLRGLEESRSAAGAEVTALRRDLTEFRAEMRANLETINQTLRQIYAKGSSTR